MSLHQAYRHHRYKMSVFVCVSVCVCVFVCMCMLVCVHMCVYVCFCAYLWVSMCMFFIACVCFCAYLWMRMCVCVYVFCACVCLCICRQVSSSQGKKPFKKLLTPSQISWWWGTGEAVAGASSHTLTTRSGQVQISRLAHLSPHTPAPTRCLSLGAITHPAPQ